MPIFVNPTPPASRKNSILRGIGGGTRQLAWNWNPATGRSEWGPLGGVSSSSVYSALFGGEDFAARAAAQWEKEESARRAESEGMYQQMFNLLGMQTKQTEADIRRRWASALSEQFQRANAVGMGNATIGASYIAGAASRTQEDLNRWRDMILQRRIELMGNRQAMRERFYERQPNYRDMLGMLQSAGASGV